MSPITTSLETTCTIDILPVEKDEDMLVLIPYTYNSGFDGQFSITVIRCCVDVHW